MTVEQLRGHLRAHWEQIKGQLLAGNYRPQPVRKVEIPKPGGGKRMLGIPTVMDRLIQQAMHQVMSPVWEQEFSEHSYGFRPGRGAHGSVKMAQTHVQAGYRWVVDLDLEKFFDRVNHDVLMARVAKQVSDKLILKLIRRYLQSGIMEGGTVEQRTEGTPQGGPLSPLLSNILLDDLDKELERRGHRFCRYADDCNVYVKSRQSGDRVLSSLKNFLDQQEEHLKTTMPRFADKIGRFLARENDRKAFHPAHPHRLPQSPGVAEVIAEKRAQGNYGLRHGAGRIPALSAQKYQEVGDLPFTNKRRVRPEMAGCPHQVHEIGLFGPRSQIFEFDEANEFIYR